MQFGIEPLEIRRMRNRGYEYCDCVLKRLVIRNGLCSSLLDLPRCSWRSRTSRVSPPLCLANLQAKFVTESINSSAMSNNNYQIMSIQRGETRKEMHGYLHPRLQAQS